MNAPAARPALAPKPPVRWYWWVLWIFLLGVGLLIFYVLFPPVWIAIRLMAWVSERSARRRGAA
jgi:hypothetical protein